MSADIRVIESAAFGEEGAALFARFANDAIAARGRFVVALTGGSTPGPIHRALASAALASAALAAGSDVDWSKVDVFFGDERAVPPDANESNYKSAHELLLRHAPRARVHRIEAERADLEEVAREYERDLIATCEGALDLLMVGVGKDAHILSLFPGAPAIDEQHALVVAALDPPMSPALSRITMTPVVITRARHVLAIAAGEEKSKAVASALEGPLDRSRYPAQLLRDARTTWLLDRAAARDLAPRD